MISAFVDSDVILDFLLDRQPYSVNAGRLFAHAERAEISLCTSTVAFLNVHYVAAALTDKPNADRLIRRLRSLLSLLDVTQAMVDTALAGEPKDLEDHVQYACARANRVSFLVTRNTADYPKDQRFICSPEVFLNTIPESRDEPNRANEAR